MKAMEVRVDRKGDLWIRGMPGFLAGFLLEVPLILTDLEPRAEERLFPRAFQEEEEEEQWRRLAGPDLAHLFQDRLDVIQGDLEDLEPEMEEGTPLEEASYRLRIPAGHRPAWLAGLNAARLALYESRDLTSQDMRRDPEEMDSPDKALALFQIQALALFQEILLDGRLP